MNETDAFFERCGGGHEHLTELMRHPTGMVVQYRASCDVTDEFVFYATCDGHGVDGYDALDMELEVIVAQLKVV